MPKVAHDFSNEIIFYIIKCNDLEKTDIYVGSTFNFIKRKWEHKSICNNPNHTKYNRKIYIYIRENGGWDAFNMTMLDRKVCVDMLEARKHEQSLIDKYKANLNMVKAFTDITRKERSYQYYIECADKIKEQKHQYYIENTDKISEKNKQWRIKNVDKLREKITCECGAVCCRDGILKHIKTKKHLNNLATKESVEIS
jgi:hypothetical protein